MKVIESVPLKRPIRAAGLTFLGLLVLVAACAPFMPGVDPTEYLLTGVAYGSVLSVFAVGLVLAGKRARNRWVLAGAGLMVLQSGLAAWLLTAGPVPSDTFFRVMPWVLRVVLAALVAYLGVGAAIAGAGWIQFFRQARRRTCAK